MLIPFNWYRQVTMCINKQEQFTPYQDVNLLYCLLSCTNFGGFVEERDKSRKLKYIKRLRTGRDAPSLSG